MHSHPFSGRLQCVECGEGLSQDGEAWKCDGCPVEFHSFRGRPVFLRQDNSLFPPEAYRDTPEQAGARPKPQSRLAKLKSLAPGRSLNLVGDQVLERVAAACPEGATVLVVGCGGQRDGVERAFSARACTLIFTDIDQRAECDFFSDGHHLPLRDGSVDGVITTAVLEHVLEPWTVAAEIQRVVKLGGFLYSTLPFLQGVHEGAYDFTRFTLGGHRYLFRFFAEREAGLLAGPGTALVWNAVGMVEALVPAGKVRTLAALLARWAVGWVKYLDWACQHRSMALDHASCTYFWGIRQEVPLDPRELVARYSARDFSHFVEGSGLED